MFWSIVAAVAARSSGLVTMVAVVPTAIHYLGSERYGMWMTISAFVALFAFVDLGVGKGLMSSVAKAHGGGELNRFRSLTSTSFFLLLAFSLCLSALFLIAQPFIPWARLYNVTSPQAVAEAGPASLMFVGCNLAMLPFSVAAEVRGGLQSAFSHSLWVGGGNLLSLAVVLQGIHLQIALPWLVLAMAAGPLLGTVGSFASLFFVEHPELRPSQSSFSWHESRSLVGAGALFLALEVASFLTVGADNLLIAQFFGAESVTTFSVSMRLYSVVLMGVALVTSPLWPAYAEALSRGDLAWIRRTLVRSVTGMGVVSALLCLALFFGGERLVLFWVGASAVPSRFLLGAMALMTFIQAICHTMSMLLNAAHAFRILLACAACLAVGSLGFKLLLSASLGLAGVAWGGALAYLLFNLLPLLWVLPRMLKTMPARD